MQQDREDERYIFRRKIIPLSFGLLCITIVFLLVNIPNIVVLSGCMLIYAGLISILIRFLIDYKKISGEVYDLSLLVFLNRKEARLKSWKSTPVSYHFMFIVYVMGLVLLILGNDKFFMELQSIWKVFLFVGLILFIFVISALSGEYYYRKRHRTKHMPLLQIISRIKKDLEGAKYQS
jgi:uncharacterized membrane protein